MQKSMQTYDLLEAAKRAIIWIEVISEKSKEVKEKIKMKKNILCIIIGKNIYSNNAQLESNKETSIDGKEKNY